MASVYLKLLNVRTIAAAEERRQVQEGFLLARLYRDNRIVFVISSAIASDTWKMEIGFRAECISGR